MIGSQRNHHHLGFVKEVLINIFILPELGLSSLLEGVSQFLQLSLHKERFCAFVLRKPLTSMSFPTTSLYLFLDLPFFGPSTTNFLPLTSETKFNFNTVSNIDIKKSIIFYTLTLPLILEE